MNWLFLVDCISLRIKTVNKKCWRPQCLMKNIPCWANNQIICVLACVNSGCASLSWWPTLTLWTSRWLHTTQLSRLLGSAPWSSMRRASGSMTSCCWWVWMPHVEMVLNIVFQRSKRVKLNLAKNNSSGFTAGLILSCFTLQADSCHRVWTVCVFVPGSGRFGLPGVLPKDPVLLILHPGSSDLLRLFGLLPGARYPLSPDRGRGCIYR